MKKLSTFCFSLLILFSFSAYAQNVATVQIGEGVPVIGTPATQVLIPVMVDFSNVSAEVCAFDLTIAFDENVLTEFIGLDNVSGEITETSIGFDPGTIGPTDGEIYFAYFVLGPGTTLQGKIFDLVFEYSGGDSGISFVSPNAEGITEIGDCNAEAVPTTFINGSITEVSLVPIGNWVLYTVFGLIAIAVAAVSLRRLL